MSVAPAPRHALHYQTVEHDSPLGCWTFVSAIPTGPLAEWVELFWTTDSQETYTEERILPRSCTEVLFNLGPSHRLLENDMGGAREFATSWISGLQQRPLVVESQKTVRMAGVRLRPAGVLPFLGQPPEAIARSVVLLDDIFGAGIERLRLRLLEAPTLEDRLRLLADDVERRVANARPCSPGVLEALYRLGERRGTASIRDIARHSGWSERHFISRFRSEVGLAPKSYARILRFEHTMRRLQSTARINWAELAQECGYYDQSHLTLEFREFAGATPTEVYRRQSPDGLSLVEE